MPSSTKDNSTGIRSQRSNNIALARYRLTPSIRLDQLAIIAKMFPQVVRAFDRLSQQHSDGILQQAAIHNIFQVFQALLDAICDVARSEAVPAMKIHGGSEAVTNSAAVGDPVAETAFEDRVAFRLCQTFLCILQCLSPEEKAHEAILEGIIFTLLRKIGQRLAWAVFEEEPPAGPGSSALEYREEGKEERDLAVQAQAPYLVWLLTSLLELAAKFFPPEENDLESQEAQTLSTHFPHDISVIARLKLQKTLLKAVYGSDRPEDFEPSFSAPLIPRDLASAVRPTSETVHHDAAESFKTELWRLFGWDVLKSFL